MKIQEPGILSRARNSKNLAAILTPVLAFLAMSMTVANAIDASEFATVTQTPNTIQSPINGETLLSESSQPSDEAILSEADELYWQRKYNEALPLYTKLVETKTTKQICDGPLKLHRMADLADCLCRLNQYEKARMLYKRILDTQTAHYGRNSIRICKNLTDLAACYFYLEKYNQAETLGEKAEQILDKNPSADPDLVAAINLELGQIYYAQTKYEDAAKSYEKATKRFDQPTGNIIEPLVLALQGEAACYYHDKRYAQAAPILERIANLDRTAYGIDDVRYGWAIMNLSDVYRKLDKPEKAAPYYEKCVQIFRRVNLERILNEQETNGPLSKEIKDTAYTNIFGKTDSAKLAQLEDTIERHRAALRYPICLPRGRSLAKPGPWHIASTAQVEPPVWLWMDPTIKQKAKVICVHGLGLNARTFDAFARKITPRGFTVLALDVRGFGAYANSQGKDKLDLNGCIDDLTTVVKYLRSSTTALPVFILGESMGGAIALQFTAKHPELVEGLICSVPAGSRYESKKTSMQVAVRLMQNMNKPFDIGKQVINQATAKDSLKQLWESDPFNRLSLSPKELVDFQLFMNQTKSAASKIKDRPVIFFQGGQDKLVKAQGTIQIFKEIVSKDKDLVLLGSSEHLVFEEGQFGQAVLFGVIGWMLAHLPEPSMVAAAN